jgi:hypothetical protein
MSRVIAFARKKKATKKKKVVEKIVQSSRLMLKKGERLHLHTDDPTNIQNPALLSLFSNYRLACFPFHPRTHFCLLMNINVSRSRGKALFSSDAKAHMFIFMEERT